MKTGWLFSQIQILTMALVSPFLSIFNYLFINIIAMPLNQKTNKPFSLCIHENRYRDSDLSHLRGVCKFHFSTGTSQNRFPGGFICGTCYRVCLRFRCPDYLCRFYPNYPCRSYPDYPCRSYPSYSYQTYLCSLCQIYPSYYCWI